MQSPKQLIHPSVRPSLFSLRIWGFSGLRADTCLYRTYMVAIPAKESHGQWDSCWGAGSLFTWQEAEWHRQLLKYKRFLFRAHWNRKAERLEVRIEIVQWQTSQINRFFWSISFKSRIRLFSPHSIVAAQGRWLPWICIFIAFNFLLVFLMHFFPFQNPQLPYWQFVDNTPDTHFELLKRIEIYCSVFSFSVRILGCLMLWRRKWICLKLLHSRTACSSLRIALCTHPRRLKHLTWSQISIFRVVLSLYHWKR